MSGGRRRATAVTGLAFPVRSLGRPGGLPGDVRLTNVLSMLTCHTRLFCFHLGVLITSLVSFSCLSTIKGPENWALNVDLGIGNKTSTLSPEEKTQATAFVSNRSFICS